eukprot:7465717-Pyramimonas_sp.AAC.1
MSGGSPMRPVPLGPSVGPPCGATNSAKAVPKAKMGVGARVRPVPLGPSVEPPCGATNRVMGVPK